MGGEGPVPALPCFSSIALLKGEVNVQLMKQFPFGWVIFQNHFCLESSSLLPEASCLCWSEGGAPPSTSLPYCGSLEKLSDTPQGQTGFPAKLLEGQGQRDTVLSRDRGTREVADRPPEGGRSLTGLGGRETCSSLWQCQCFINDKDCKIPPLSLQLVLKRNFL